MDNKNTGNKNTGENDTDPANDTKALPLRDLAIESSNFAGFYAFGILHSNASTTRPVTYTLSEAKLRFLYKHIPIKPGAEYVIISTRTRTECFLYGPLSTVDVIRNYLTEVSGDLRPGGTFFLEDEAAIFHLTERLIGLDGTAQENAQLLSRVKEAYKIADEEGRIDVILHRLLHTVFRTVQRIHTETGIAQEDVSQAGRAPHNVNKVLQSNVAAEARAICKEMLTDFVSWCYHYQAMQPAIDAMISTFEKIRRQEIDRNKKRFSGLNHQQLDHITKTIMKRMLAIPAVRLKEAGPHTIDYVNGIKLLQLLFAYDKCEAENASSYNQARVLFDRIAKQEEEHATSSVF